MDRYEGPAEVYINGRLLAEAKSVTFTLTANNKKVYTMIKGLAGHSAGPRESEAKVELAVPKAGAEGDFYDKCSVGTPIRLVFVDGGKRHTVEGWIESVDSSRSTDADAGQSFTFMGGPLRTL